jgi:hypothetical protein
LNRAVEGIGDPPAFGLESASLPDGLYAASLGRDLVLLDLAADEYLCLPDCGPVVIDGAQVHGAIETLLRMSAEELLCSGSPPVRRAPPSLPSQALPSAVWAKPAWRDVAIFGAIWIDAVRKKPTVQALGRRMAARKGGRDDLPAIAARVEVFRQLLPFAPWTGACLLQAELLLRFLNAAGLDADWVVGVRTWPFLAHCWLQVGDVSVSEPAETLTIYRPILVM